ncbi:hypothetical protein HY486_03605 [Candidatus Woesearchaeota archaeon]|nr:hypothetical protein [Candidatus Woesearchaeota archaeon]
MKIRRREFFGVCAAVVTALRADEQENFAKWYSKEISEAKGKEIIHPDLIERVVPDVNKTKQYEKKILGHFPDATRLEGSFISGQFFHSFDVDDNTFENYSNRMLRHMREFFDFIGVELPNFKFSRLTEHTVFGHTDEYIPLHVVWNIKTGIKATYAVHTQNEVIISEIDQPEDTSEGEFTRTLAVEEENGTLFVSQERISPIFIAVGPNSFACFTSPLAEALHFSLTETTIENALRDANKQGADTEKFNSIMKYHTLREEGICHALLDYFVEVRHEQLGFSLEECAKYSSRTNKRERYLFVPVVKPKIHLTGAKNVLKQYYFGAENLFK